MNFTGFPALRIRVQCTLGADLRPGWKYVLLLL